MNAPSGRTAAAALKEREAQEEEDQESMQQY